MAIIPDLSKYEKFQKVTQGTIRYYESGRGRDVLLLHGMGAYTTADTFMFMFEKLAKRYHVIAPDHLGFGKSTRILENGPTFDVIVDGHREFLNQLGINCVDLIGHSAGPWFGGILAYESPHLVRSFTAIGAAGMNVDPVTGVSGYQEITHQFLVDSMSHSIFPGSAITQQMASAIAETMLVYAKMPGAFEGLKPLVHQMANPGIRKSYLLQRRLPFFSMPSLWIWGEKEGIEPGPTWTREWNDTQGDPGKGSKPWVAPNARYVMIPEATHNVHWEFPTEIFELCTDFIESVPIG